MAISDCILCNPKNFDHDERKGRLVSIQLAQHSQAVCTETDIQLTVKPPGSPHMNSRLCLLELRSRRAAARAVLLVGTAMCTLQLGDASPRVVLDVRTGLVLVTGLYGPFTLVLGGFGAVDLRTGFKRVGCTHEVHSQSPPCEQGANQVGTATA